MRACIASSCLLIVSISSFIAGGPVLIIGVKELKENCNNRVDSIVINAEPTSEYGMCSIYVWYTDHNAIVHEARVQHDCMTNGTGVVIPGCYNARHPGTLFTDDDHLDNVASYNGARAKVIAGINLQVFAVIALIGLCFVVWVVRPDTHKPMALAAPSDATSVPRVVRRDSASEMPV